MEKKLKYIDKNIRSLFCTRTSKFRDANISDRIVKAFYCCKPCLNHIDELFPHNKEDNFSQLGHLTEKYGHWLCILHVFIFRTNATWTSMYTWLDLIGIPGAEISVMRGRWIVALPITCLNACSTSQGTWRPSSPIRPLPMNCQESGGTEWGKFWSFHFRQTHAS